MKIKHRSILTEESIRKVEEGFGIFNQKHKAKYLLDCALPSRHKQWSLIPCAIFYQQEPYPETGSHYFALYFRDLGKDRSIMITDASWIEGVRFTAVPTDEGLVFSIHRHDYVTTKHGFIDGGRDYLRTSIPQEKLVHFEIENGNFWIVKADPMKIEV